MATFDILANDFGIDICENTKQHSVSHFHNVYEICLFTAGTRTYIVDGNCVTVRPGSVILVPPYVHHSTRGSVGASRTVVYFSREFLARYFTAPTAERLLTCFARHSVDLSDAGLRFLIGNFELLSRSYTAGDEAAAAVHLGEILTLLDIPRPLPAAEEAEDRHSDLLASAVSYIAENLATLTGVREVAEAVYISPSYLALIFKQKMGQSVMQYVLSLRVGRAVRELVSSDKSVSQIAGECGFASATHFTNTFRHHIGMSPSAYRTAYKER